VLLTLARWRGFGDATPLGRPDGHFVRRRGDATVRVDGFSFAPRLLSIPRGSTVRWRFGDDRIHDATLVRGPRGFATATVRNSTQSQRFSVPGEYRLYCSIHPVQMSQVLRVR
jgi:plastocyanin